MLIGHENVAAALEVEFPPVALLSGPESVGKWTCAEQVRRRHQIFEPDVLRVRRLDIAGARAVADFASRAPVGAAGRVALVNVDAGKPGDFNVLLKPLEEVGPQMHFMLVASRPVPTTIETRARRYDFSLLSVEDMTRILTEQRGLQPSLAKRLAELSGGQVRVALEAMVVAEDKATILSCVRALREKDAAGLEALAERWRDEHTSLLGRWATEAVSGRWRFFNPEETGEVGRMPLRVLVALRRDVRPRLVVRSVLMDVLRGS